VEVLAEQVWKKALGQSGGAGAALPAINARHQSCLNRAGVALTGALEAFSSGVDAEFVAADLRAAATAIGEVTGKIDADEVLGEIFGRFCIGK
jgi:tRNA modification GTPase